MRRIAVLLFVALLASEAAAQRQQWMNEPDRQATQEQSPTNNQHQNISDFSHYPVNSSSQEHQWRSDGAQCYQRNWFSDLSFMMVVVAGIFLCCRCQANRRRERLLRVLHEQQQPNTLQSQVASDVMQSSMQDQLNFHRQETRRIEQFLAQQQQPYIYQFGYADQVPQPSMNPIQGPSMMSVN